MVVLEWKYEHQLHLFYLAFNTRLLKIILDLSPADLLSGLQLH